MGGWWEGPAAGRSGGRGGERGGAGAAAGWVGVGGWGGGGESRAASKEVRGVPPSLAIPSGCCN